MMSEVLSSLSILLATIALLYSSWQADIRKARELKIPQHYIDGKKEHDFLKETLWKKTIPLCLATTLVTFAFLPETVRIIWSSVKIIISNGFLQSIQTYNAMPTALVIVNFALFLLSSHLLSMSLILYRKNSAFKQKRQSDANESLTL